MAILVVTYNDATGGFLVQKIGSAQINDGAIVSGKIASGQIGIPHIYPGAVTSAKIAALAVGTPHIAALAIVSGKVASGGLSPLTSGKIWAGFTGNIAREENKPTVPVTPIRACELLCNSNNTLRTKTSTTYVKAKEILLVQADFTEIKIRFDLAATQLFQTAYGRIYRNGVAIGTEQANDTDGWVTYSEDLDASAFEANDLIQLYVKVTDGSVQVRNFRFYYSVVFSTTNQDPA